MTFWYANFEFYINIEFQCKLSFMGIPSLWEAFFWKSSLEKILLWTSNLLLDEIENFNWSNLLIMPIIVSGGDSDTASQRDLRIFALCSLIDKRDASRTQMNVIGFSILCIIMASWGLKISLGASCILLIISIIFAIYALYMERSNLR